MWPSDALQRILGRNDELLENNISIKNSTLNASGEDIADVFDDFRHRKRLEYVLPPPEIPGETWEMFIRHVESNSRKKRRWGLSQSLVNGETQPPTCDCHGDEAVREISLVSGETIAEGETKESATTATGGSSLGTGGTNISGEASTAERTTEKKTTEQRWRHTRTVYECGTDDPDCRLNRRAFCQVGNETFSTGSAARERRREQFQEHLQSISTGTDPSDRDDSSAPAAGDG